MNDDFVDEELIEDNLIAQESVIITSDIGIMPGATVYQIRLLYSKESFYAVYQNTPLSSKDYVIIPTRYGQDLAQVLGIVHCNEDCVDIVCIERMATAEDLNRFEINQALEKEAFLIAKEKIEYYNLNMKLVTVHYLLNEPKILFFFVSDTRIDFRELVKDLVNIFKSRVELRQIGIRDEARIVEGMGVCGRGYCCHAISDRLKPVSIKMAKDQNLSLNSMKISGPCGRLLCCLAYEHNFYAEYQKNIPPESSYIRHVGRMWKIVDINVITGTALMADEDGRQLSVPLTAFEKKENDWYLNLPAHK
ncbi:MAG: hypothetical protein LBQ77_02630 [Treponema sp.]|jgi:cell fate regulator YaaT (PSP1 superfamily)|nr:hypothetical protein [Treponema sp.]